MPKRSWLAGLPHLPLGRDPEMTRSPPCSHRGPFTVLLQAPSPAGATSSLVLAVAWPSQRQGEPGRQRGEGWALAETEHGLRTGMEPSPKAKLGACSGTGNIFVSTWESFMKPSLGLRVEKEEAREVRGTWSGGTGVSWLVRADSKYSRSFVSWGG